METRFEQTLAVTVPALTAHGDDAAIDPEVGRYGDRVNLPPDSRGPRLGSLSKAQWWREVAQGRLLRVIGHVRSGGLVGSTRGRPAALVEVVGLLLWFLLFRRLHAAAGTDIASATTNALALQFTERALHLDIEQLANKWLSEHPSLIQPALYYYRSYYAIVLGVLLWVFLQHPNIYLRVRRTLVAMSVLALPVFWVLPMSPPRFALPGVVDIIADNDSLWGQATRDMGNGQNHFSAMPSLHVGWSLWCAYAVWSALRPAHPRLALLSWAFPLGMVAVVLTTGNHYVLDVAGSAGMLILSIAAASVWGHVADRWRKARSGPSGSQLPA
jgi:PAP2 superfamily